ncbi:MAG: hypothetical protein ACREM6_11725 [Vulcanimicrobiaceae bacterium]
MNKASLVLALIMTVASSVAALADSAKGSANLCTQVGTMSAPVATDSKTADDAAATQARELHIMFGGP